MFIIVGFIKILYFWHTVKLSILLIKLFEKKPLSIVLYKLIYFMFTTFKKISKIRNLYITSGNLLVRAIDVILKFEISKYFKEVQFWNI